MSGPHLFDAGIPVLTEVLWDAAAPAADGAATAPAPATRVATAPAAADPGAQLEARAVEGWSAREWDVLERHLSERILRQVQGSLDFTLAQCIRDSMADVLQHALENLTGEIRAGLQHTIGHVVAQAVSQELTHLREIKK